MRSTCARLRGGGCCGSKPAGPVEASAGLPPASQAQGAPDALPPTFARSGQTGQGVSSIDKETAEAQAQVAAEEAQLVASLAATPLPDSSKWLNRKGGELEPLCASTTMIDAAWLLRLAKGEVMPERKGVIPAWQELPPEASVSVTALRRTTLLFLPIAVISYGWAARDHPDPTGEQLQNLVPVLEVMVHSCEHGLHPKFQDHRPPVWAVIWDFMSLPQRGYTTGYDAARDDRTPYEQARFRAGIRGINHWYGHLFTTTLVCDWTMPSTAENGASISKRGWCIFERELSSIRKSSKCFLHVSKMMSYMSSTRQGEPKWWGELVNAGAMDRAPPVAPDAFEKMLREGVARAAEEPGAGIHFTNGKDATEICIPQYREAFLRLTGDAVEADGIDVGIEEISHEQSDGSLSESDAESSDDVAGHAAPAEALEDDDDDLDDSASSDGLAFRREPVF